MLKLLTKLDFHEYLSYNNKQVSRPELRTRTWDKDLHNV